MDATPTPITVRRPRFDLADLPRWWAGGSRLGTHFGNAGHVFIPLGEELFIDSVSTYRDQVDDADQRKEVKAFIGQEAVHKRAHADLWDVLRGQGVPVDRYARFIGRVRSLERHLPDAFCLSVTAALEHYTACFGHSFLTEDLGEAVPPEMERLLAWHGLEELEHRAVAYDVLQLVDDRWSLRMAGFAFATGLIVVVPAAGTALFAWADRRDADPATEVEAPTRNPELRAMWRRFSRKVGRHLVEYLKPGFHPSELDVPPEAARWEQALAA